MSSRVASSGKDRRIKPRFEIAIHAKIQAKLIGAATRVDFVTDNISESGLLLFYEGKDRLAFNEHTILEVWLYTDTDDVLFFFAKFVRYQEGNRVAIRIIDMDAETIKKYSHFIHFHASREID